MRPKPGISISARSGSPPVPATVVSVSRSSVCRVWPAGARRPRTVTPSPPVEAGSGAGASRRRGFGRVGGRGVQAAREADRDPPGPHGAGPARSTVAGRTVHPPRSSDCTKYSVTGNSAASVGAVYVASISSILAEDVAVRHRGLRPLARRREEAQKQTFFQNLVPRFLGTALGETRHGIGRIVAGQRHDRVPELSGRELDGQRCRPVDGPASSTGPASRPVSVNPSGLVLGTGGGGGSCPSAGVIAG
jgi:hypothetical protein